MVPTLGPLPGSRIRKKDWSTYNILLIFSGRLACEFTNLQSAGSAGSPAANSMTAETPAQFGVSAIGGDGFNPLFQPGCLLWPGDIVLLEMMFTSDNDTVRATG